MKRKFKTTCSVSGLTFMLMLVFSSFVSIDMVAQNNISGVVTGGDGVPLPGVSVVLKGTSTGAATDFDGNFSLVATQENGTLVFSYLGFKTKEVVIGKKRKFNIILEEDIEGLDEVVVIGYAAVEREKVLGAVASIDTESIQQATPVDALQGIQGKLSGVQVLSNNGPGAGFDIRVRGVSTFTTGATGPLYVVDGQQTFNIDNLDPSDIASLEVLKDGATAAIYGAQAANGVVIITTKQGKSGELKFSINHTTGYNQLVGQIPVSNALQRIQLEKIANPNPTRNQAIRDSLSELYRNSEDIQKLITRPAVRSQTNIALSGGSEKIKFYWNTGYLREEGIIVNSAFKRINTRIKLDIKPSEKFEVGTVANLSFDDTNGTNSFGVLNQLTRRISYFPIYEPNGEFTPSTPRFASANPLLIAEEETIRTRNWRINSFNYIQWNITPQLSLRSTLGLDFRQQKGNRFTPSILDNRDFRNAQARGNERHWLRYNVQQENYFNYKNSWNKHNLVSFAGMQIQRNTSENLRLDVRFLNDLVPTLNNYDPEFPPIDTAGGDRTQNSRNGLFSLFAGFNYDYANKYLFGATIRRDGSSRFGENSKFGIFPSLTAGWRISNEGFLKGNNTVNNLMLRASYGVVGNDRIGNYEFSDQLEPSFPYNGGVGFGPTVLGNPDLQWEETESVNLGLDLGMFQNRLKLTADFYEKRTDGLLVTSPLPEESGFSSIRENRGVVENRGIDLSLSGSIIQTKDFSWNAGFNISFLENEVVELSEAIPSGRFIVEEGEPIGNIRGFKSDGVFSRDESNAFTPEGERLFPNFDANGFFLGTYNFANGEAYPVENNDDIKQLVHGASGNTLEGGDYIWDDTNGDFIIDNEDIQILGNGLPTVYGGLTQDFRYKNFTVGVLFDYSFGNQIYRRYDHERNSLRAAVLTPSPDRIDNAWSQQGDITPYPFLRRRPQNRFDFAGTTANSFYVTDGDFIKWRYIQFGYSLSKKTLDQFNIGLKSFRLNLSINNVLTWTNYEGYNPEFGSRGNPLQPSEDNLRYPNDRELLLSLSVQF